MAEFQDTKQLLEIAETISGKILGDKKDSLRVECMNGLGVYETTIHVDNRFSKWVQKRLTHGSMEFPASQVYTIKTTGFSPFPQTITGNVTKSGGKLILDLNPALEFDLFRIEIFCRMDDDFLKSLVRGRASPEPLRNRLKYQLSAQLRNPEGLMLNFSEIQIEEFPVSATVHIAERINTNVPEYVKQLSRIEAEILGERNPHEGMKIIALQRKKAQLQKKLGKTSLLDKIQDLSLFLTPSRFISYIEIVEDFRLHQCERGHEFFKALGMLHMPKSMEVISRTDLSLKKPAASGSMIYESKKFEEDVSHIFK